MAKENKYIATVEQDPKQKTSWKRLLGIGVAGATLIGGSAALANHIQNQDEQDQQNTISSNENPGIGDSDFIGPTNINIKDSNRNQDQDDGKQGNTSTTQSQGKQDQGKTYTTPSGETITDADIAKAVEQAINDAQQNVQGHKLTVGDRVTLEAGTKYYEDSWGNGRVGYAGINSGTEFRINQICLQHNNDFKQVMVKGTTIEEAINNYAQQLGVNPSEIKAVASVTDVNARNGSDTGWAVDTSIDELTQNVTITFEKQQQSQDQNQNQQSQNKETKDQSR